ncbi:MAG TPA: tetratricopeptide repeat protein, partial [Candidatus Methylomirabilis sp.]|nr:tetratricopeptide repeat protein [Candidatus Methylomirabilis sp.]
MGVWAGALALTVFLLVPRAAPAADAATLHTQLGLSLSARGLHREALAEFERAYALDPTNPVLRRNLARAHANLGAHLL